jgi:FkbM family methyltransferase
LHCFHLTEDGLEATTSHVDATPVKEDRLMITLRSFVRTAVERLSRERSIKRRIDVRGQTVELYVSPDAQLKYLKPGRRAFDVDLITIAEQQLSQESVVWDVGANVGVFTFASASVASAGTIVAIEADIWLANLLRRSSRLPSNAGRDVRVIPVAVSSQNGVASFIIAERGRASNALEEAGGHSQMGDARERQLVPTLRLDTLLEALPAPTFVKIDVEGAELMVLHGAQRLIQEARPTFYVEVGTPTSNAVFELFTNAGYVTRNAAGERLTAPTDDNVFFVPA